MKKYILLFSVHFFCAFSQNKGESYYLDFQFFRGNIYKHTSDISHLIVGHPDGFLFSVNKKTNGSKEWHRAYNYPDYGLSLQSIDFKNPILGKNFAVGLHYNFYFFKRQLLFRISQGIAMTTNPYSKEINNKNNAFGTKILDNNYFFLQYQKQNILGAFGFQAGFLFTHFSNGRFKAPNSGLNAYALTLGLNYNFEKQYIKKIDTVPDTTKFYKEHIKYNIAFRTGISEGPVVGLGQREFFHVGLYVDKRIGRKSALQLGTDLFFSNYLKNYIKYKAVAFPDKEPIDPNVDYKRVGLFVGHELFINKLSIETQLGYYIYKPFKYEVSVYQRLAMKYYLTKSLFTGFGLKTHGGRAEAIEFTVGGRL